MILEKPSTAKPPAIPSQPLGGRFIGVHGSSAHRAANPPHCCGFNHSLSFIAGEIAVKRNPMSCSLLSFLTASAASKHSQYLSVHNCLLLLRRLRVLNSKENLFRKHGEQ